MFVSAFPNVILDLYSSVYLNFLSLVLSFFYSYMLKFVKDFLGYWVPRRDM